MRYVSLFVVTAILVGCATGIQTSRPAETSRVTASESGGTSSTTEVLQLVLTALTAIANDVFSGSRQLEADIAAVLMAHDLDTVFQVEGEMAALELLCAAPAPGDMPISGVVTEIPEPNEDEPIVLRVTGEVMEAGHVVSIELVADSEEIQVRIRGGGWLLCALFEADLEIDGAQWDLPLDEGVSPTLDISTWPPEDIEVDDPEHDGPIGPLEVLFSTPLPYEAAIELLEAERLVFWAAETPIELYPSDSEEVQRFLEQLRGPTENSEI